MTEDSRVDAPRNVSSRAQGSHAPRKNQLVESALNSAAAAGLLVSLVTGVVVDGPTLWGLLPIGLYAVLAICGMSIIVATMVSIVSALLILLPAPRDAIHLLGVSVVDQVTMIGLIIILGGGLAEVLRTTGVAGQIVRSVMRFAGGRGRTAAAFAMMMSCLLLVAALGTLAGALAVAVPLLLPIAAKMGFTRTATASTIFVGGCAGLALAPFAGSNVAIMNAAGIGYIEYVLFGAGPLAILSIVVGLLVVPWMQRRTENDDDFYSTEELGADEGPDDHPHARRATAAFGIALLISVAYAIITSAGITFPLVTLPLLAILTGLSGGLRATRLTSDFYRGATALLPIFLMFLMLSVLFNAIILIDPFTVVIDSYSSGLGGLGPFPFAVVIALIGWVGVPGATAAQVVLLDQLFGELGATIGVGVGTWVVVLLFASKADTYGPFPNANMIGAMGLARSISLKNMLITGWCLLIPSALMYLLIMFVETR
ncbi:SLC13 family permease [Rhodococcus qingshengii]|uniref:SLC13 family permease n=1 Tax=Rhodococcus qingshengii TaxID=334542 RepID=UPI001BED099F|nr:SLC13 family permease [Rhodococcus qingshengii]MBT2274336.1 permease [Rhodococcus qingshengii]